MRIFKRIAILCAIVLCNCLLSICFTPASYMRCALHEVQSDAMNYDTIIVGQSHGMYAYNPNIIDMCGGVSTYNLCRKLMCMRDIPYVVKEANYKNTVKCVILDMDPTYWVGSENPSYYTDAYVFPYIRNPKTKLEYLLTYAIKENYRYSLCRYISYGLDDVKKIPSRVKTKMSRDYRDYEICSALSDAERNEIRSRGYFVNNAENDGSQYPLTWNDTGVSDNTIYGFKSLVLYCNSNDIKLVCITPPLPSERVECDAYNQYSRYITELMDTYEIEYIDYNESNDEFNPFYFSDADFRDGDGHMREELASRFSEDVANRIGGL